MVLLDIGDIFLIKVHDTKGNFLGYVNYRLLKDPTHKEYVLELGSKNKNEALRFELYSYTVPTTGGFPNIVPNIKALLPGATPGKDGPTRGDYIVFRGQGGEFNPLLFGTTEYINSDGWILAPPDATSTEIFKPMATGERYSIFSITKTIAIFKLVVDTLFFDALSTVFNYPRLGVIEKIIRAGAHGRSIDPPQLRFGSLGKPKTVTFSFELV